MSALPEFGDLTAFTDFYGLKSKAKQPDVPTGVYELWGPIVSDEQAMAFLRGSSAVADAYDNIGVSDPSEARMTVAGALAKATNGNREQARRLLLESPLVQQNDPAKAARDFDNYLWAKAYDKGAQERAQDTAMAAQGRQIGQRLFAGQVVPFSDMVGFSDLMSLAERTPVQAFTTTFLTPIGEVTLVSADGGVGKSYFALTWAIGLAVGWSVLSMGIVAPVPVIFVSAEDSALVCARRVQAICPTLHLNTGVEWINESLKNNFHLWDIDGNSLWTEQKNNPAGAATNLLAELESRIVATGAKQVFIDNASTVFLADHNALVPVNAFIGALRRIAARTGCNIVLLAHVNAETATRGGAKTYNGSVAWNNSVRSRMFMKLVPAENDVPEHILVSHEKANLGPKAPPFRLKRNSETGVLASFSNNELASAIDDGIAQLAGQVCSHIKQAQDKGDFIRCGTNGPMTYYHCLTALWPVEYPEGDKMKKKQVLIAIRKLHEDKQIAKRTQNTTIGRNSYEAWVVLASDDPMRAMGI